MSWTDSFETWIANIYIWSMERNRIRWERISEEGKERQFKLNINIRHCLVFHFWVLTRLCCNLSGLLGFECKWHLDPTNLLFIMILKVSIIITGIFTRQLSVFPSEKCRIHMILFIFVVKLLEKSWKEISVFLFVFPLCKLIFWWLFIDEESLPCSPWYWLVSSSRWKWDM